MREQGMHLALQPAERCSRLLGSLLAPCQCQQGICYRLALRWGQFTKCLSNLLAAILPKQPNMAGKHPVKMSARGGGKMVGKIGD